MHVPSLDLLFKRPEGVVPAAQAPGELLARALGSFDLPPANDSSILIGNRWLSRGDIAILASTSGMGKSSLSIQAASAWGLGTQLFSGFTPNGPLKSLIIQAEDGDGDIAEVRLSLEHAKQYTPEQKALLNQNVIIVTDRVHRGLSFRAELKRLLALHKPDIVWINPLLAFIGGDVNDSTDVGTFLREQLNSLNDPPTFAYIIVHHTAKPPKERAQRQWNEVMYEMAGSADLTNAARAILALQATETPGEFNLILAKRGARAGLTKPVPQGAGFRQEPVTTITLRHSKDRMEVNGQNLPVIHWERGEDRTPEQQAQRAGRKPSNTIDKYVAKIPTTPADAAPPPRIFKAVENLTDMTRQGFHKMLIRAYEDGRLKMVEKPGLGPCFYLPPPPPDDTENA